MSAVVWLISFFLFFLLPSTSLAAVQGDTIVDPAQLMSGNNVAATASVNVTVVVPAPSKIEFLEYAPSSSNAQSVIVGTTGYRQGNDPTASFTLMPPPVPLGSNRPIDLTVPVPLSTTTVFHQCEPIFVRLTAPDQNIDRNAADTALVTIADSATGAAEVLNLTETGPNTGVFTGYIQTSSQACMNAGPLQVKEDSGLTATFSDAYSSANSSVVNAIVDPYGIVFDSATGQPVNGVSVTMLDSSTGAPAMVFGDDGASAFPATVTTGGTTVDASGRSYSFPAGSFRFPFARPGVYRFRVVPSASYKGPSTVPDELLQTLPGAPFVLVPGSRSEPFTINAGPSIRIDIPLDPVVSLLWFRKSAGQDTAAIGDFLPYQLDLQNTSNLGIARSVVIVDTLPIGFRYRKGSTKINGAAAPDPAISPDGRGLTYAIGDLSPNAIASIRYVVEIGAGAKEGTATNVAIARSTTSTPSNMAAASVQVRSDFFNAKSFIMGRVIAGECDSRESSTVTGVEGVRIYMEDGTFVDTDKQGMFHFEGVNPGSHVVQLDTDSLPPQYEMKACEENTRFAGSARSQFVDLQGGSLWRADFHLGLKPKASGEVGLKLRTSLVSTQTGSINNACAQPGASLFTARTGTFDTAPCYGELQLKHFLATARTGTTRPGGNGYNDNAVMVPFANERCRVPDGDGQYTVAYAADLHVGAVPVRNLQLIVTLPDGVTYAPGCSALDGGGIADPEIRGNVLTYNLGERPAGWKGSVLFLTTAPAQGAEGNLSTKALLIFDTPAEKGAKTPEADTYLVRYSLKRQESEPDAVFYPRFAPLKASLSERDRQEIEKFVEQLKSRKIEHITVTGHTDSKVIRPGASKEFPDNYALSRARAKTVAKVVAKALRLSPDQITIIGKGPDEPIATNKTDKGRQLNRRVEFRIDTRQASEWTYIRNDKESSETKVVATNGLRPGETWLQEKSEGGPHTIDTVGLPHDEQQAVRSTMLTQPTGSAASGTIKPASEVTEAIKDGLLSPADGAALATRINAVRAVLNSQLKPQLLVDGKEIPADRIGFSMRDNKTGKTLYSYIGVDFGEPGEHIVVFKGTDPFGNARFEQKIAVKRTGEIALIRVKSAEGNVADGKTPVRLQLEAFDAQGNIINAEYDLEVRGGTLKPQVKDSAMPDIMKTETPAKVHVDAAGNAFFQPVNNSGHYRATLAYNKVEVDAETYVKAKMRDWILVGLGEGTVGYNVVKGNMESFSSTGDDDKLYENDRLAFYAKGSIKGEWLLTMSYDSAKRGVPDQNGLYQTIDPNKYYTLYGDATDQRYDAASARPLYLKIERDQFYALFGDYDTGLTVTELSRYSRQLNGVKSEMKSDHFDYTLFASQNDQTFVKDEIRGDGTSGLYHLSRKNIVLNSETVVIETRDRYRSEVILSSQPLSRYLDYSIDYDTGTIFFKSPVFNTDANFNPIFIVVRYEIFGGFENSYTYGGRGAVRILNNKVELGATHIHEEEQWGRRNPHGSRHHG